MGKRKAKKVKIRVFDKASQAKRNLKKNKTYFGLIKNYAATLPEYKNNLIAQNSPVLDDLNNLER